MKSILFLFIILSINCVFAEVQDNGPARTAVHLLSYMAQDYSGAVDSGKVKDQGEYNEQLEFAGIIVKNLGQLKSESSKWASLATEADTLLKMCREKRSADEVSSFALSLKNKIVILGALATSPAKLPDVNKAKELFVQNCVSCHGQEGYGDGELGKGLEPAPTNFHGQERLSQISPFGAFNTIKLGVNGTGMQPWAEKLSDQDIWALSFYVTHMRYSDKEFSSEQNAKNKIQDMNLSLDEASTNSDRELAQKYFQKDDDDHLKLVALLRLDFLNGPKNPTGGGKMAFVKKASFFLQKSKQSFLNRDLESSQSLALSAYLEGIEPIEPQLKSMHPKIVSQIELHMSELRSAIKNSDNQLFEESLSKLDGDLTLVAQMFEESQTSNAGQFAMAMGIVLREGLEAVLIVATILTVINAFQIPGLALWVHAGWISALFLGVISWFFTGMILGGLEREMMEGLASYFAVVVLLSMGLWLHSKTEIGKWKDFIKDKTQHYISGGKMFGVASISFVATFREVFETVVFLRALTLESGEASTHYVLLGLLAALTLVIIFAYLFIKVGAKLPLSKIFSVSSILMLILAVILAGKGTHSLQEAGVLPLGPIAVPTIEFLGIYPSLWTLLAQALIALLALVIWPKSSNPSKSAKALGQN